MALSTALIRKARRLVDDPVLRRWTFTAALGCRRRRSAFELHRPPYLSSSALEALKHTTSLPAGHGAFRQLVGGCPAEPLILALPGENVRLAPGDEAALFERHFSDTETMLAAYRFAWLPIAGRAADPRWVTALWQAFTKRFAQPDSSWAWHPYTAAERAINILDYADREGLPGPVDHTLSMIARHAAAITAQLEYFGEHNTSNHLANNGRGLYRIGLALGLPQAIEIGKKVLLAEAQRIFRPSGVLREGSTHYHLLLARNYADVFLAARAHGRPEADAFAHIVRRTLSVLPQLLLPGGLPLIGDISPDCPPGFLSCLLPGSNLDTGWASLLAPQQRSALQELRKELPSSTSDQLLTDGWARFVHGRWAMLSYVAPDGWLPMPGHAHQDMGSFELHWDAMPLIVDLGRGTYGETGEAAFYAAASAHNSITVDGQDPYPANKPYYDEAFRRAVCGAPPSVTRNIDALAITFSGFSRLSGVGNTTRTISVCDGAFSIIDDIGGHGSHVVRRRLHVPWPVSTHHSGAVINSPSGKFVVESDGPLTVAPIKRWTAYGMAEAASALEIVMRVRLPTRLRIRILHE